MTVTSEQLRTLYQMEQFADAVEALNAREWLSTTYGLWLWGGWKHQDGRIITKRHNKAIQFHEACKELHCPKCWSVVGYIGSDPKEVFHCKRCDKNLAYINAPPDERCGQYSLAFVSGGNQSVLGGNRVWDEGGRSWRRIEEIDGPLTVLGWNGEALVPATAYPYDAKPAHDILHVTMASGASFDATPGHRVLGGDGGWRRVGDLRPGARLLAPHRGVTDPQPWLSPPSNDARTCAPTGSGRSTCSPGAGPPSRSSGGGRRLPSPVAPSPLSAPSWTGSGLGLRTFRLGRRSASSQDVAPLPWSRSRALRRASRSSGFGSQAGRPPTGACGLLLPPTAGSARWATPDCGAAASPSAQPCTTRSSGGTPSSWRSGSSGGPAPSAPAGRSSRFPSVQPSACSLAVDVVERIDPAGKHVNYDLWVPGCESFVAEGVIHHNSSKSTTMMSEFCSWIRGERPWDNSLTCTIEEPGDWLLAYPSHSEHGPKTIWPYFKQRMGDCIVDIIKDQSSKAIKCFVIEVKGRLENVYCSSYEQAKRSGKEIASAFESARLKGVGCDEPPPSFILPAIQRGLSYWHSRGWGRLLIAGTSVEDEYLFNRVFKRSWNLGGDMKEFFSIEFDFLDNPALTQREADNLRASCRTPEEADMRLHGRFRQRAGQVFAGFSMDEHVYDIGDFDPLLDAKGQAQGEPHPAPSDWPVVCVCDPHDQRPWVFQWWAVSPTEDYYLVREWPYDMEYESIRRGPKGGFKHYANVIAEREETLPGGKDRVVWRYMDPRFGPQSKAGMLDQSVQEGMAKLGYWFDCDIDDRTLEARHNSVRDLLSVPFPDEERHSANRAKMRFQSDCRNSIWAMLNYVHVQETNRFGEMKIGVRESGKDHADCTGWVAIKRPPYGPWNRGRYDESWAQREMEGWENNALGV